MSVASGFFNSVNGDRIYNADDLNHFFEGIISDGIFKYYKHELKVVANGGMSVRVLNGKAICLDKYVENTAALDLKISGGNALPRYDAVVVNVNLEDRNGYIYVKEGTQASSPVKPTMVNTVNSKEMCLAYIYVSANVSVITESNIEDTREDYSVCGWCKLTNVSSELKTYRNDLTLQSQASVIDVGIAQFDTSVDTLFVYENGLLLEETNEYLIEGTGSAAKVHLSVTAPAGNRFSFVVQHLII